jgi:hypothetical protein
MLIFLLPFVPSAFCLWMFWRVAILFAVVGLGGRYEVDFFCRFLALILVYAGPAMILCWRDGLTWLAVYSKKIDLQDA